MAKLYIVIGVLLFVTLINAQGFGYGNYGAFGGIGGFGGMAPAFDLEAYINTLIANRLLTQNLPDDLQEAALQLMIDTSDGIAACETATVYWQNKKCTMVQLKKAMSTIKAIEQEAAARAATSTVAPVPT